MQDSGALSFQGDSGEILICLFPQGLGGGSSVPPAENWVATIYPFSTGHTRVAVDHIARHCSGQCKAYKGRACNLESHIPDLAPAFLQSDLDPDPSATFSILKQGILSIIPQKQCF